MATTTASAIAAAKQAIGKADKYGNGANLHLSKHDGQVWATNKFWLTRVGRIGELLDKFNVPRDQTGTFAVTSTVQRLGDDAPKVERMLKLSDYPDELKPLKVGSFQAYAKSGDLFVARYETPDGVPVAVRDDWLTWLSEVPPRTYSDGEYGPPRYLYGNGRIAVVANRRAEKAGTGIYDQGRWIPTEYEDKGDEILSVVMPYNLGP